MLNRVHHGHDPDTGVFAAATGSQTVEFWSLSRSSEQVEERKAEFTLATERSAIRGICFVAPSRLMTVHASGAVAAWEVPGLSAQDEQEAELVWEEVLEFEPCLVESFGEQGDAAFGVAIGGKNGELALVRPTAGEINVSSVSDAHKGDVTALAFSQNGKRLASGGRDRLVKVWQIDRPEFELSTVLHGCEAWPLCLAFSRDGRRLVNGSMDNGIYLWDVDRPGDDPLLAVAFEHHGWVVDVAWAPDDAFVAAASWDNSIGIYEGDELRATHSYEYHGDYVSSLLFIDDSPYLLSGSYDHTICVWNWQEPTLEKRLHAHDDWVLGLSPIDEERVASVSSDQATRLWHRDDIRCVDIFGESVSSGFELGEDSGFESFVDEASATKALEAPDEEAEAGGVRVERPDEVARPIREVRRPEGPAAEGTAKTPMRILDEAVEDNLDESLTEGGASIQEELEKTDLEADAADEESATDRLDQALESIDEEALSDAVSVDGDAEVTDAPMDTAPPAKAGEPEPPEEGGASDALSESDDGGGPDERDDMRRKDGGDNISSEINLGTDVSGDVSESVLDEFLESAPEDLGLDAISSTDSLSSSTVSRLDEATGNVTAEPSSSEYEQDEQDNPFATSPETQPLAEERVEQAVSRDRAVMKADEKPDGDDAERDKRLKDGLRKLKARAKSKTSQKDGEDQESGESNPISDPKEPEGREVPTSRVELGIEGDVASAFDDLIPEPDEPSPPSLGLDDVEESPGSESDGPSVDDEVVEAAFGNTTQLGMLSEGDSDEEQGDTVSHAIDDGGGTLPDVKPLNPDSELSGDSPAAARLSPGDSEAIDDLEIPEVRDTEEISRPREEGPELVETDLSDLWARRSAVSAPGMGIVKRPLAADTLYKLAQTIETVHRWTYGVDLHPRTKRLVSCGGDTTVVVWGFDGEKRHQFEVAKEGVNDVRFHPDGNMVFAGGEDHLVHAWLIPQKTLAKAKTVRHAQLEGHRAWLTSLAISSNGKVLLSGSFDGTARAWHLKNGQLGTVLEGHDGPVADVGFSDARLVTVGQDGALRVWNASGLQLDQLDGFGEILSLDCNEDGYAWTSADGRVFVHGAEGTRELVPHDDEAVAVDLKSDGAVVSAGKDGRIHLYEPADDKPFQTLEVEAPVWSICRGDDYLAVGTDEGRVQLYKRG